tara:strand:- start:2978 stop:4390 length:1413 start_codon:yes stop_codon:yes gene_type:complete
MSNQMNIDAIEKVEILPMNPPPNNAYSFRNGNPIVQFQIANAEKFLMGSSLRLNGTFRLNRGVSTETNIQLPDNNNNKGGGEFGITINNKIGLHSTIQQITLSNQQNQSLETIRNYNRYLASVVPNTHSADDLNTSLTLKSLGSSSHMGNALMVNNDAGFSLPLLTGMLNSANPIPLGNNGIRGLVIQLELAPDSSVIHNSNRARATDATANNGAFYQLRDLSLTFDLLVPDESGKSKMAIPATGAFQYNSVNNLYSVVNTNDLTQTLNLGTSNTLSVIHNFIPTTHINNYLQDGFKTTGLQNIVNADYGPDIDIKEVHFTKGGVKFPLDYEVDCEDTEEQNLPSVNVERNFVNAIKPIGQYNHNVKSLWTSSNKNTKNDLNGNPKVSNTEFSTYQNTLNAAAEVVVNNKNFGIGVNFDPVSRVGINFKNTPYGIRIKSNLDGNSPNSIYTYTLNKNTLQYSPGGIVVSN